MNRYLPHNLTAAARLESVIGVTGSLPAEGRSDLGSPRVATSVRRRENVRRTPDGWLDETHRRERLSPVRKRWSDRATKLNGQLSSRQAGAVDEDATPTETLRKQRAYAVARVQKLNADMVPRLRSCSTEKLPIACRCGLVGATKSCRQWWLCSICREKRTPTLGADIRRGLGHALDEETARWGRDGGRGMRPRLMLLTLTTKHSGNLSADHHDIATGWRKLYKRMHEEYGAFPYVGVWEVTTGRDGLGHVHLHIAVIWQWRDFGRIREQWSRYVPESMQFDIKHRRRDGKDSTPSSVGKYLGKYLSKGADIGAFTPYLRAEVSAAFYNQRSVLASVRFWKREERCCSKCKCRYRLVEIERVPFMFEIPSGPLHLVFHGLEPPANPSA